MKIYSVLFGIVFASTSLVAVVTQSQPEAGSDRVTVHNKTPRDLYYAIYYIGVDFPFMETPKAVLSTPVQFLETESSGIIQRPPRKVGYDRELVFVEDKELLKPEITKLDLEKYHAKNVGNLQGDVFYIGDKEAEFYGYTTAEWNIVEPIILKARTAVINQLPAISQDANRSTVARVRAGNDLPAEERQYIAQRMPRIKQALERIVNTSLDGKKIPRVAIVCSGGGYRAMLYTTGALVGADKIGVLDATQYLIGLSGSTWAIGGWILSGMTIAAYHEWLVKNIYHGLARINSNDARLIGDSLLTKYFFDEPFDVVDLYGSLIANELFAEKGELKQRMTLSAHAEKMRAMQAPFPIYTAIAAESLASESLWYEFTPFEVGATWIGPNGLYVPSWAFGRRFKNGTSVNFAPEQNFGVLMGTFGLAIGITIDRLIKEIGLQDKVQTTFVKNIIKRILEEHGERRLTSSDFANYTYQMMGSKYANSPILKQVDAGIHINLPYTPVMGERPERQADIIFFVDASGGDIGKDLKATEDFARSKGFKFPAIDYAAATKRVPTMFKDDSDPQTPIVIYVPRIIDRQMINERRAQPGFKEIIPAVENLNVEECIKSGPCSTFNFKNTEAQARAMTGLGMINMMATKDLFAQAIAIKAGISPVAAKPAEVPTQPGMLPIKVETVTLPFR